MTRCQETLCSVLHQTSSDIVDENVEPQPLWEYPGDAMSEPVEVMTFHFNTSCADIPDQQHKLQLTCQRSVFLSVSLAFRLWRSVSSRGTSITPQRAERVSVFITFIAQEGCVSDELGDVGEFAMNLINQQYTETWDVLFMFMLELVINLINSSQRNGNYQWTS